MWKRIIVLSICLSVLFSVSSFAADVVVDGGLEATSNRAAGIGVFGWASATGPATNYGGVFTAYGDSGIGIYSQATATGPVTNYGGIFTAQGDTGKGVYGEANGLIGIGVNGYAGAIGPVSNYGGRFTAQGDFGRGVYGEANGLNGIGVYGYNPSNLSGYAGYFSGRVHVVGNLSATGTKPFVQPHVKDPSKEVVYVAAEGPEVMVFFRGTGVLKNGKAIIQLPDYFSMVASEQGVQVQVTPTESCNGIYVAKQGRERIEVREINRGKHHARFNYLVTGIRAGFEGHQPIVANTHFKPGPNDTAKAFEDQYKGETMGIKAIRAMLIANGILTPEGKLNRDMVANLGWKVREEDLALLNKSQ